MKKQKLMNQLSGVALLAAGAVLIIWGYNESQSLGSQLNQLYFGNPSKNTFFYYIGGGICVLLGAINLLRK